jgi:hypothetical protein
MKGSTGTKRPMPAQAQGKGLSKMPPGIAKKIAAGKPVPAGIQRTRAALLSKPAEPVAMKNGGKVKKYAMGGPATAVMPTAGLPSQAAPRAASAMAARPGLPTQAAGARPFKKGGMADKAGRAMTKKGLDARGRAMRGK